MQDDAIDVLDHTGSGRALHRALLGQCSALLRTLDAPALTRGPGSDPCNTIGGHLRHLLDHHEALLQGLDASRIDYATRRRNTPCERGPALALARIAALDASLERLPADEDGSITVVREDGSITASTVARELDFVASHTTHHLAIVALLAHLLGIRVPPDLGVAVSTLRYRRAG